MSGWRVEFASLDDLLEPTGIEVDRRGTWPVVRIAGERDETLVRVDDSDAIAAFEIPLPELPAWRRARALRYPLRATHSVDYLKAFRSRDGGLVLGVQAPMETLTPSIAEGLLRSLARFATLTTVKLPRIGAWLECVERCMAEQAAFFSVDVEQAGRDIRRVLNGQNSGPLRDGCHETTVESDVALEGGYNLPVDPDQVTVCPKRRAVSLTIQLGSGKWKHRVSASWKGDQEKLSALLGLNRATRVAKLGLDGYDRVVIAYDVPKLTMGVFAHATTEFEKAKMGLLEISRSW